MICRWGVAWHPDARSGRFYTIEEVRPLRVLFVCLGNAIRSQMAEGFAKCYGSDVMVVRSAGLTPAVSLAPFTRKVMAEKNIDLGDAYPKSLADLGAEPFDLIINLSGVPLPSSIRGPVREWQVRDPMGGKEQLYRETSNEIEILVMRLIIELRNVQKQWAEEFDSKASGRGQ